MRIVLFLLCVLLLAVPAAAQDVTSTPDPSTGTGAETAAPSIEVSDQFVFNGILSLARVVSEGPGFVAIHVDLEGTPGPLVGIAPVQAGTNENVLMLIDTTGAKPNLMAVLHADDTTIGVFEHTMNPAADLPVGGDPMATAAPFRINALTVYQQQIQDNVLTVASVIMETAGWVAVYGDEGGQPGAESLGQIAVSAGTTPAVMIPVTLPEGAGSLFAVLHTDDGQVGTFESGQVEGADAPINMNGIMALLPVILSSTPTVLTASGTPIGDGTTVPSMTVGEQALMGAAGAELTEGSPIAELTIDSVSSPFAGWIDVHADGGGHPSKSLGMTPVAQGENSAVVVTLNPNMQPVPPFEVTPIVWPMLHIDDANPGVYDYLMIPFADLPIVVNGRVLTVPVSITGGDLVTGMDGMMSGEATMEGTPADDPTGGEATPESTPAG
ncbi:MAG: hypothetical protein SF123_21050 [Chloroflexota bacterium]|nr:hypothetical protein [Chloroflexota bacterium]